MVVTSVVMRVVELWLLTVLKKPKRSVSSDAGAD